MKKNLFFLPFLAGALFAQTNTPAPTVTYLLDSSWNTGLQGEITIGNTGSAPLNNWTLSFTYPYAISSIWNAVIASHVGNVYTIAGASWNTSIAAAGTTNFGWIAATNGTANGITGCVLNHLTISSASCPSTSGVADTTPPSVPANLASTAQTTTTAALAWSPSTDSGSGVAGYYVWEGGIMLGATTASNYNAAGLTQGTSYTFSVQAFDNAGNLSAKSSPLTVTTQPVIPCGTLPGAPGIPAAVIVTSSSATISWAVSPAQANCTVSYRVYDGSNLVVSGLTANSYQLTGLAPSNPYTFGVLAVNQAGRSAETFLTFTTAPYVPPPPSGWPTRVFAPYIDITAWPTPSVSTLSSATGQNYFTLAFITSQGACQASWGGVYPVVPTPPDTTPFAADIAALQQAGGNVIVSFGGENGVELAQSCTTVQSLLAQYEKVITTYNVTRIDFDIEGGATADRASINLRNQALAGLQAWALQNNRPLIVQYTLPVLPTGLTQDGVNLVANAFSNGVNLGVVNLMAMDYGGSFNASAMGANAIAALTATFTQLQAIYSGSKTPQQLYSMLGVTPMIGMNDSAPEVFSLADAASVLNWAQTNQIGLIAMWSAGRDVQCPNGQNYVSSDCSGVPQAPHAFIAAFRPFTGQ